MQLRRAISTKLPPPLKPLKQFIYNYWWSWTSERGSLFRVLAPDLWQDCQHNPVALMQAITPERLWQLAEDPNYLKRLQNLSTEFHTYLQRSDTWAQKTVPSITDDNPVAYFCIEYGIHESLPLYCGGLGVLAGDHLKSASDLGLPMVGVGLLYRQGYFSQRLNRSGWQEAQYRDNDFDHLPLVPVCNEHGQRLKIRVTIRQRMIKAQVWQVQVGRSLLYLLDTDIIENDATDRLITNQLYSGDSEKQLTQEILLGIGGVRMLQALGIEPAMYHLNDVHAAFALLEMARFEMDQTDSTLDEVKAKVCDRTLFTTHTPVPTGQTFSIEQIESSFADYWPHLGLDRADFLALGAQTSNPEVFSMTALALQLTGSANAVSKRHGEVSRQLWQNLYSKSSETRKPLGYVTNGIHARSWIAPLLEDLYQDYLGLDWAEHITDGETWSKIENIPDERLWQRHQILKARLIAYTRDRVLKARQDRKECSDDINAVEHLLDPKILTLGFARRFSDYKRSDLIFRDLSRLTRIFSNQKRPVQLIIAGKARPNDTAGKRIIQRIMEWSCHPDLRDRIAFIEDYDMYTAKLMVQGIDLWLNTPRRPLEASGTSGQKVALNGGINFSVLDGWWCEGYRDSVNGWSIGKEVDSRDQEVQDTIDAESFYSQLEREIVRIYYDCDRNHVPRSWVKRMKASIRTIAPIFNSDRMVRDYVQHLYLS
ncbi:alpha-glucan family phosphorylase [Leptothoe kymatousa]|uniref:Alpha-glucan family phosphorylase n=1 Tax=Leptothoe kymatousa TAU-MAC 1615 TaxID=2364775 RepID=A0ABS5Y2I5_9CYAN|nr:alpha-glucan family phosphorylase [Leptothoe kymatousa]MBT9311200.1 alpha-glucan family phosphorylase [Leptothoe kymatousa TAU-MAC 1615]